VFTKSATFYDALYGGKDYAAEAERIHELIQARKLGSGDTLLDVGCGSGAHLAHLRRHYEAEGLDLDPNILAVARQRCPGLAFHEADLADFDLERRFGAVVCLFSSIGYVRTVPRLRRAAVTLARHLEPGGVLVVEPWLGPDEYGPGRVHARFVDLPDLKVARMNANQVEGRVSVLHFHYLVGRPSGVEAFEERHELGLFTPEEYVTALTTAGLEVTRDPVGLEDERGLYIGVCPPAK
jgi:SAM-dependent methyltransferase